MPSDRLDPKYRRLSASSAASLCIVFQDSKTSRDSVGCAITWTPGADRALIGSVTDESDSDCKEDIGTVPCRRMSFEASWLNRSLQLDETDRADSRCSVISEMRRSVEWQAFNVPLKSEEDRREGIVRSSGSSPSRHSEDVWASHPTAEKLTRFRSTACGD